ncbi:MAG: type IV secretory system conjugative DNA transfer family protein [Oscillibacter sp.]|nr:type IV secretory system conjugative DNA transfer family protein [Oscillibacter sp.]
MSKKKRQSNLPRMSFADNGTPYQLFPAKTAMVPEELLLDSAKGGPGFFVGGINQFKDGSFVGVPPVMDGNFIIVGGSGSGKSTSVANPTLRTWPGPIFAVDVKGELAAAYAEFFETSLRQGKLVRPYIILDLVRPDSRSYDPLWWPLKDDQQNLVENIWEIVYALIPRRPEDDQPFWEETERGVLAAALYYFLNLGLGFSEIMCKILSLPLTDLCQELSASDDPIIIMTLGEVAKLKPETLACVDRGLRNKLVSFSTNGYLGHFFRGEREGAKCLNWDDLRRYNIFLRVPEDKIEQWGGAVNLIQTQLIRYLERQPDRYSDAGKDNPPVLLLFDEFARLGKLEQITNALSTLRSKNVHIALVVQSVAQIDQIYGEKARRIIFDNSQYQIIMRASDPDTQRYISELIGTCIRQQSGSSEHMDAHFRITGYSDQQSEVREWAVHPHTLSTMEDVILLTPYGIYRVDKAQPYLKEDKPEGNASAQQVSAAPEYPADYWMALFKDDTKGNPDAVMLDVNERTKNAAKRASSAKRKQRKEKINPPEQKE